MARKDLSTAVEIKARRLQQASEAMKSYEAERREILAKTERLRAERLAREAENPDPKPKTKKRK